MASLEVVRKRSSIAVSRIASNIDRLGGIVGKKIEIQNSKDPEVNRVLLLESIAEFLESIELVPSEGQEQDVNDLNLSPGIFEVVIGEDCKPNSIRKFGTRRSGNAERVL